METKKRLVLKKKTIQVLDRSKLNQAAGGISGNRCNPSEDYGCSGYCDTVAVCTSIDYLCNR